MNILLTGGTGYIGSHTAVILVEAGHNVVLYDNLSNSKAEVVGKLQIILGKGLPFVQGDIRNTELVEKTIKTNQIDAVIHFAGLKAVGESTEKPLEYYENNVSGTISLLKAMQATGIKTLIFSSSATVYGNPQYLPIDEAHPTSATNPYGRTKLHIEEMLRDLVNSDTEWKVACLRYFNPVGAHESGLIGEDTNGIPNNLMPYVAQVAAGRLPYLEIYGNDYPTPDGTGIRDYIHIMDLAEGHSAAINFLQSQRGCHLFNLGTGQGNSVLEMIKSFEETSGKQVAYRVSQRRAGDVAICYAFSNKAQHELGWSACRGISEMCSSSWKFTSKI